jgi:UDP-N-acetylglucosamine:LPS N-acetylglucosamine transferase
LLASADVIVTKPGYATTVEAVAHRKPVVYIRRYNFADEAGLVEYLHRYGCGVELSAADFAAGCWESALAAAASKPKIEAPASTGAAEAAKILATYL